MSKTVLVSDFLLKIKTRADKISQAPNLDPLFRSLSGKIKKLCSQINAKTDLLPTSFCHNDFTPWNMYINPDFLKVYDWELAGYAPVLTDLFHFHIQKGVLTERKNYNDIKIEILNVLEQPEWKAFIKKHRIDVHFQFSMYLLKTVTYYLHIYQQQSRLHWQAIALIKVWEEALEESITRSDPQTFRKQFILSFMKELENKKYALLKFICGSIDKLPETSDLDILIVKTDLASAIAFINTSNLVSKVKLVRKSFMTTTHIFFKDGSFLEIDLITAFKRKQHTMMNASDVLEKRHEVTGIFVPDIKHDFEYIFLFHQLNGSSIPKRYQDYFKSLPEETQKGIAEHVTTKYFIKDLNIDVLFIKNEKIRKGLDLEISNHMANADLKWFKNKVNYLKDTLSDILQNRGFTLTVSGVDGAGKSTVIEEIKQLLENKYRRKVVILRHRPSVLPILSAYVHGKEKAEKLTTERLPRTGTNQSKVKSLIRFSYYLTDYLAGQFYVLFKYILRGKVVVYDRYYFDFMSDAKRSNIVINPSIPRALYSLIHKPELNIFLYAPASEILKRKQELNKAEIESLTKSYKELFEELSLADPRVKYLAIQNLQLQETLDEIESKIIRIA